jgi:hypothetical protein
MKSRSEGQLRSDRAFYLLLLAAGASCATMPEPRRLRSRDGVTWVDSPEWERPTKNLPPSGDHRPYRLTDMDDPLNRPALPPELSVTGRTYSGLFEVCASSLGAVMHVVVTRSTGEAKLDRSWISRIENWRYRPYKLDGPAAVVCTPVLLKVSPVD